MSRLSRRLGGDALAFVEEAEQDVLGADVVVVQMARFFLGQDDDPAGLSVKRSNTLHSQAWHTQLYHRAALHLPGRVAGAA